MTAMSSFEELAREYRESDKKIMDRLRELKARLKEETDDQERDKLESRIHGLEAMHRDTRDQAVLLERYYDRGYRRNARYTI